MPVNLVSADYVISGIRQQMLAAGCNLVEKKEEAELICEARCGALGTDGHSVIYGIPPAMVCPELEASSPGRLPYQLFPRFHWPSVN